VGDAGYRGSHPDTRTGQRSLRIGVMPFRYLGPEDEPDYLGEGLTEELMRLLSRLAPMAGCG
jgi:TolB-like protein